MESVDVHALFGLEPFSAEEFGKEGYHSVIGEKEAVFLKEQSASFESFEFALEFSNANDTGNEFDVVLFKEVLVFPLRIFCYEADGRCSRVDDRVSNRTGEKTLGQFCGSSKGSINPGYILWGLILFLGATCLTATFSHIMGSFPERSSVSSRSFCILDS
jgi:hypothetical protein